MRPPAGPIGGVLGIGWWTMQHGASRYGRALLAWGLRGVLCVGLAGQLVASGMGIVVFVGMSAAALNVLGPSEIRWSSPAWIAGAAGLYPFIAGLVLLARIDRRSSGRAARWRLSAVAVGCTVYFAMPFPTLRVMDWWVPSPGVVNASLVFLHLLVLAALLIRPLHAFIFGPPRMQSFRFE